MTDSKTLVIIVLDKGDLDLSNLTERVRCAFEAATGSDDRHATRAKFYEVLNERQRQIVRYVVCGLTNKEIAFQMSLAAGSVAEYLSDIYARLDVSDPGSGVQHSNRTRLSSFFGDFFEADS